MKSQEEKFGKIKQIKVFFSPIRSRIRPTNKIETKDPIALSEPRKLVLNLNSWIFFSTYQSRKFHRMWLDRFLGEFPQILSTA